MNPNISALEASNLTLDIGLADKVADWAAHIGVIGCILAALSVVALSLVLLKLYQFHRLSLGREHVIDQSVRDLQAGRWDDAERHLSRERHPAARLLQHALNFRRNDAEDEATLSDELQCVADDELDKIEWGFRPLGAIAQLSPLLGLLGTVLGMIAAFADLEGAGEQVSPALLAGGIWQALLTTAMGLAVAIPVRAILYFFEARGDRAATAMQHAATRALNALKTKPVGHEGGRKPC